jgi:hypothetical protein
VLIAAGSEVRPLLGANSRSASHPGPLPRVRGRGGRRPHPRGTGEKSVNGECMNRVTPTGGLGGRGGVGGSLSRRPKGRRGISRLVCAPPARLSLCVVCARPDPICVWFVYGCVWITCGCVSRQTAGNLRLFQDGATGVLHIATTPAGRDGIGSIPPDVRNRMPDFYLGIYRYVTLMGMLQNVTTPRRVQ